MQFGGFGGMMQPKGKGKGMMQKGKGKGPQPMKPGDWNCPNCGDHQFAKNDECRKCGTANPDPDASRAAMEAGLAAGFGGAMEKPGDWYCPGCNDLQFARNAKCRKCDTPNPDPDQCAELAGVAGSSVNEKPGDWHCPGCNDLQFARNVVCRKCGTPNPGGAPSAKGGKGGAMKPGDWFCTSCGDHQFAANTECRQCGTPNFAAMVAMMSGDGMAGMMGQMTGGRRRAMPY